MLFQYICPLQCLINSLLYPDAYILSVLVVCILYFISQQNVLISLSNTYDIHLLISC